MRAVTKMSPLDEMVHTDYAVQASHRHLVRYGQPVGVVAMQEEACRGIDIPVQLPPCGGNLRPEDFGAQLNGFNTAASHPPVYYAITGVLARALKLTLRVESFVTAARLVGALWLAAGLVLLWFLLEELHVGYVARTAVPRSWSSRRLLVGFRGRVRSKGVVILRSRGLDVYEVAE